MAGSADVSRRNSREDVAKSAIRTCRNAAWSKTTFGKTGGNPPPAFLFDAENEQ